MDIFDYEITKPRTPQPPEDGGSSAAGLTTIDGTGAQTPTLNEEVNQALGQLSRFWGGFRRQACLRSQSAFEAARKDFGTVVSQARTELGKIATEVTSTSTSSTISANATANSSSPTRDVKGKGKETETIDAVETEPLEKGIEQSEASVPTSPTSSSIFSRLQAQLPPNLQPNAISSAISAARSHSTLPSVDFNQLRSSVTANIQQAQTNLNFSEAEKLAESYLSKLKAGTESFAKDAGDFFKEAVKVVPPEEGVSTHEMPIVSGTDVWLFPSPIGTTGWGAGTIQKSEGTGTPRASTSISPPARSLDARGGATRSEALLRLLKYDPDLIRLDPAQDEDISSVFEKFVKEDVEKNGGISGETYIDKISTVLAPGPNGLLDADAKALIDTRDVLVPSEMSNDVFWTRYFFRVHQVTKEEEKRKALLADAVQGEELFSWEDDEDEHIPSTPPASKPPADLVEETANPLSQAPSNPAVSSLGTSRRTSEDSYDVIDGARLQSPAPQPSKLSEELASKTPSARAGNGDSDSDWE
ncbi:uncharacterized protein EI90DRAFT_2971397 [Cantharellus anzutake]|uniref:uncharacterized protein n=1 Tax=Cantharellus anzutake TaxID=1750568 RepID=UPI00190878A6|nr:uncharacterized protein EI90DRAFT_2971397 [Cantharellus anzutake]KAF8332630.1 hypothetical protein EI90DRAFT_2971397 [Cantharellus anzutake]